MALLHCYGILDTSHAFFARDHAQAHRGFGKQRLAAFSRWRLPEHAGREAQPLRDAERAESTLPPESGPLRWGLFRRCAHWNRVVSWTAIPFAEATRPAETAWKFPHSSFH